MMQAKHSIEVLAWELSFEFGLIKTSAVDVIPNVCDSSAKWITFEVIL